MLDSVYAIARGLMRDRHMGGNKFSQLLTDLVLDAHKRQAAGEDKNLSELLSENRKLKEGLSKWRGSYRGMTDMAAKYQSAFQAANAKLETAQKVSDPFPPR